MVTRKGLLILQMILMSLFILIAGSCNKDDDSKNGKITGSLTDTRDGNVYKTVIIGNQTWMTENLRYLPSVAEPGSGSTTMAYYYIYGYKGTDLPNALAVPAYSEYGVLYNWTAAMAEAAGSNSNPSGVRGVCPAGWHLPSDAEWEQLMDYLADNGYNCDGTTGGGGEKLGKAMAATSGWESSSNAGSPGNTDFPEYRNKSGFTALPGGYRDSDGTFGNMGLSGYWWSATTLNNDTTRFRSMNYNNISVVQGSNSKELGYSVRCVRD